MRFLRGRDIDLQFRNKVIKHQAHPPRGAQVLVHCHPDLKIEPKAIRHQLNEVRVASRDPQLTNANPEATTNRSELGKVAVGSQGEQIRSQWDPVLDEKPCAVR